MCIPDRCAPTINTTGSCMRIPDHCARTIDPLINHTQFSPERGEDFQTLVQVLAGMGS
jgi:hypothetical protein